jgi:NAD(P)-dependent dehydrogenase (short-subunit alcohol dehydrogenase family)
VFSRISQIPEPFYARNMKSELTNQSVVVVGGTSGMGLAIARLAASRGAYVTVASRSPEKVAAAASEIGVTGKLLDTTYEASVREFFSAAGQVDHLVVTGSSVRTGTLKDSPLADAEFTFRSKFFGPYLCVKYAQVKWAGSITLFFRNPFPSSRPQRRRARGS